MICNESIQHRKWCNETETVKWWIKCKTLSASKKSCRAANEQSRWDKRANMQNTKHTSISWIWSLQSFTTFICGSFSNIASPFRGLDGTRLSYYTRWQDYKVIGKLLPSTQTAGETYHRSKLSKTGITTLRTQTTTMKIKREIWWFDC